MKSILRSLTQLQSTENATKYVARRSPETHYNDEPVFERIVFICGLHRSGTTLLERLISTNYDVSYLRANVPESEGQHMQSVYRPAYCFGGSGRFAFSRKMKSELEELLEHPERCREQLIEEWSRFWVGDGTTLLEKSPSNLTKISWLRAVFPKSKFVILARDPRATAAATQKWSGTELQNLMRHWDVAYSQALDDFQEADCILSRYEELCEAPEFEISRVASFLDLFPRKLAEGVEAKYEQIVNSNARYIEMHGDATYGPGVWSRLGYTAKA